MKINKMLWIIALVLIWSIPSAFAQPAILQNPWVIFGTNIFIVWFILFILQAFIIPKKEGKEKVAIWVITFVLAVVIVWNVVGAAGYIWQVGALASFFSIRKLVNFALIGGAAWFGFGLAGIDVNKTKYAMVGFILLALLIAGGIANSIGDKWLWDTDNFKATYDYFLGPERPVTVAGRTSSVGGILRPESPYRLFIFLGSAFLWSWFFAAFLNLGDNKGRLNIVMAVIIAALMARQGSTLTMVITLAEVFFLLIIGKQIAGGGGLLGGWVGWGIAILLTEFIFCGVLGTFGQNSAFSNVLDKTIAAWEIDPPGMDPMKPFGWLSNMCPKIQQAMGLSPAGGGSQQQNQQNQQQNQQQQNKQTAPSGTSFWRWLAGAAFALFPPLGWYLWRRWHP